jgi:hypothetical protein
LRRAAAPGAGGGAGGPLTEGGPAPWCRRQRGGVAAGLHGRRCRGRGGGRAGGGARGAAAAGARGVQRPAVLEEEWGAALPACLCARCSLPGAGTRLHLPPRALRHSRPLPLLPPLPPTNLPSPPPLTPTPTPTQAWSSWAWRRRRSSW